MVHRQLMRAIEDLGYLVTLQRTVHCGKGVVTFTAAKIPSGKPRYVVQIDNDAETSRYRGVTELATMVGIDLEG